MIRVSVLGATGYTGRELLTLLLQHPTAQLVHATTTSKPGVALADAHPALRGVIQGALEAFDAKAVARDSDYVFSCLPHKESMGVVASLLTHNPRLKVIDLSGDFRFKSAADYEAAYGVPHEAPQLLSNTAYGLTELFRSQIQKATIVANPGCYPTATLLPLAPFAKHGLLSGDVIVDAKSGVSGAGAASTAGTHFPEANESVKAYSPFVHRHQPEISEHLAVLGARLDVHFVPHLVPMNRGILSTIYATLAKPQTGGSVHGLLTKFYADEPFVRVLAPGQLPETKHTTGTNFLDVGFALDKTGRRLVLVSALDNLIKGASGQALQNLNVLAGIPETTGLLPAPKTVPKPTVVH